MQVKLANYGLMIVAETDFEEEYLSHNFGNQEQGKIQAFLKHGISACDIVGLKVFAPETFSN